MIYKETAEKTEIKVNKKEIYRYLGYRGETPNGETLKAIDAVLEEMINSLKETCKDSSLIRKIKSLKEKKQNKKS